MMEDTWLSVEDESNSSFGDSDAIDSETEAELYSVIHYEQNLENLKCPESKLENVHSSSQKTKSISLAKGRTELNKTRLSNTLSYETNEPQKLNVVEKDTSGNSDKFDFSCSQNSEDIYVNKTVKNTISNKKKRKSDYDSSVSSNIISVNSMKKSFTVLNDSSDSDSIIWTDVDASDGKEFQTNLCDVDVDTNYVSSESESSFDCPPMSKKNDRNLRNMSMPNIKIGENIKDILWFVNEQDLRRSKQSRSRRYHDNAEDTCSNCLGKGHNYKICPLPKTIKCFICGNVGHQGSMCANRVCGRCFNIGHDSKRCWASSFTYCTLCSMPGHVQENCPDLWRRYHLTTRPGKIVHGKKSISTPGSFLYCWNCGQDGHVGAKCKESRGSKCYLRTWPSVVSYADPENLLEGRLNSNRRPNNFRRGNHLNQMNMKVGANFNSEKNSNGKRVNTLKAENGENHLNTMNTAAKKKKKKNKRIQQWWQFKKSKKEERKIEREKNFPRTPKNNQSNCFNDPIPESLKKMIIVKERRKERKRKRKLKKLLKKNNGM